MTALSIGPALFFFTMGVVALVQPERILALFGTPRPTLDGRNEVRERFRESSWERSLVPLR